MEEKEWRSIDTDISDTKGGHLAFERSKFNEIGILTVKDKQVTNAVWWNKEDTDRVIEKIKEVL